MKLKHVSRSSFLAPLTDELARRAVPLAAGSAIAVPLGGRGYDDCVTVDLADGSPTFDADWKRSDPTRFPARLRAAATALQRAGRSGRFELTNDSGVLIIRRIAEGPVIAGASRAADQWRRLVAALHVNHRRGERAVHKPLLCLLMIARADESADGAFRFRDVDERLAPLLREFGRPSVSVHPEYPFWYLQNDGFWEVADRASYPLRQAGHAPSRSQLLRRDATAYVPELLWRELCVNPLLRDELSALLLNEFWPTTLHDGLRSAIGLPEAGFALVRVRKRDRAFRETIMRIYARTCAVCGFDGRLGGQDLMIEAAHVRSHCEDGPDVADNGLALCTLHHASLDKGALGISPDLRILVSEHLSGGDLVEAYLRRHRGKPLRAPQEGHPPPADVHVAWHWKWVFRKPPLGAGMLAADAP